MRNNPFLAAGGDDDFPNCPGCNQPVLPKDRPVNTLGAKWHPGCLKCTECGTVLTVRSLESYQKKPYCKAHVPKAGTGAGGGIKATAVKDDFTTLNVAAKPKAATRQQGVDVTAKQTFVGTGQLARGGAHAGTTFGGQTADSGTYEVGPRVDRLGDAGGSWGGVTADSGTFENAPTQYGSEMYSSEHNAGAGSKPSGPSGSRPAPPPGVSSKPSTPAPVPVRSNAPKPTPPTASNKPTPPPGNKPAPPPSAKPAPPPPAPVEEQNYDQGYEQGYDQSQGGHDQGYDQGYEQQGHDQNQGYDQGYDQNQGYDQGYEQQGHEQQGYDENQGYDQGYNEHQQTYEQQHENQEEGAW